jgi:hypothetical protein
LSVPRQPPHLHVVALSALAPLQRQLRLQQLQALEQVEALGRPGTRRCFLSCVPRMSCTPCTHYAARACWVCVSMCGPRTAVSGCTPHPTPPHPTRPRPIPSLPTPTLLSRLGRPIADLLLLVAEAERVPMDAANTAYLIRVARELTRCAAIRGDRLVQLVESGDGWDAALSGQARLWCMHIHEYLLAHGPVPTKK